MTIEISAVRREFSYAGMTLADPDPGLSPAEVCAFYAGSFGELTTAQVNDDGVTRGSSDAAGGEGDVSVHRFSLQRVAGTKGTDQCKEYREWLEMVAQGREVQDPLFENALQEQFIQRSRQWCAAMAKPSAREAREPRQAFPSGALPPLA